jgi:hypothetical protein
MAHDLAADDLDASGSAEDDSPFLSIADFFSLISLAVIYIVISFAPQSPFSNTGIESVTATAVPTGLTSTLDPHLAYISVLGTSQGALIRIIPAQNQSPNQRAFSLGGTGEQAAKLWVLQTLAGSAHPKRVLIYLHSDETRDDVHKLFDDLLGAADIKYRVTAVFLQSGEASP